MKRYFKAVVPEVRTTYYEYDGDYNIRQIQIVDDQWTYATESHRRDYLADQPLSESESHPEIRQMLQDDEISAEEFEKVWEEALKRSPAS